MDCLQRWYAQPSSRHDSAVRRTSGNRQKTGWRGGHN
jgi:hypothetical protein